MSPAQRPGESTYAAAARAAKRRRAAARGISDELVSRLVHQFYRAVQTDPLLSPVFSKQVDDWPLHLVRMEQFWRSVLFSSGEFEGHPMKTHAALGMLEEKHFQRWIELFSKTLRDIAPAAARDEILGHAKQIGASLLAGVQRSNASHSPR